MTPPTDIVERLHIGPHHCGADYKLHIEAATEITRLRTELGAEREATATFASEIVARQERAVVYSNIRETLDIEAMSRTARTLDSALIKRDANAICRTALHHARETNAKENP